MMCIVILIFIPFQVAFEEFIFRGYLMQGSILLFKYRWVALLLTGFAFGLLHGSNPEVDRFGFWVAMPQYILMGLLLGLVAIWDDGLELALGLHLANNVISSLVVTHDASALPNTCPVQGYGANGLTHGYRGHARVPGSFSFGFVTGNINFSPKSTCGEK